MSGFQAILLLSFLCLIENVSSWNQPNSCYSKQTVCKCGGDSDHQSSLNAILTSLQAIISLQQIQSGYVEGVSLQSLQEQLQQFNNTLQQQSLINNYQEERIQELIRDFALLRGDELATDPSTDTLSTSSTPYSTDIPSTVTTPYRTDKSSSTPYSTDTPSTVTTPYSTDTPSTSSTTQLATENLSTTDAPGPVLDLSVSCGFGNIAINSGIAQTFYPTRTGVIDKIAIWIEPLSYYSTSYTVQVFDGLFDSTLLGESPTVNVPGDGPDMFYDFQFLSSITLTAGNLYSWMLVPQSQYSGAFNMCTDTIPGNGYWLADLRYPERDGKDYPFQLYLLA